MGELEAEQGAEPYPYILNWNVVSPYMLTMSYTHCVSDETSAELNGLLVNKYVSFEFGPANRPIYQQKQTY